MRPRLPLLYRAAQGILFSFLLSLPALGKEWYVPDDFPTIQSALDSPLVKDGDTVTVRPGTYLEAVDFKGKKVTLTSEAGPAVTVIDGDGKGTVVTFAAGEDESAVLDGFTVTGGHGGNAGGVLCMETSPTIRNNVITGNTADGNAGGVMVVLGAPVITGNVIENNEALGTYGGGIFCATSAAVITKNLIRDNTAVQGGGACFQYLPSTFTDNHVIHNTAIHEGGGIWCIHASPIVTGNTVYGNAATIAGGGIGTDPDGFPAVMNSIVWGNTPDALVGVSFNSTAYLPDEDFEGDPRIAEGTTDMGADEFHLHLYGAGEFTPRGAAVVRVVGTPGAMATLRAGSGVLDPPIPTPHGDWYLAFPLLIELPLGAVPGPAGVLSLPFTVPPDLPIPLTLPLQALAGEDLSNPCVLEFQE